MVCQHNLLVMEARHAWYGTVRAQRTLAKGGSAATSLRRDVAARFRAIKLVQCTCCGHQVAPPEIVAQDGSRPRDFEYLMYTERRRYLAEVRCLCCKKPMHAVCAQVLPTGAHCSACSKSAVATLDDEVDMLDERVKELQAQLDQLQAERKRKAESRDEMSKRVKF